MAQSPRAPVRVLRVIARLNIGGPAVQEILLTRHLADLGYSTLLVRGQEGPREGSMDALAREYGVAPVRVPTLRRDPGWRDLVALCELARIVRRDRPDVVHTHAAKAGALGRIAALMVSHAGYRPILVHTFHGHSLSGYFPRWETAVYRGVERTLARRTDMLVAVSPEIRDELVAMRVAPPDHFTVIPLGLDLSRFLADDEPRMRARALFREQHGIPATASVVTLVARLVPIKRVDRFLEIALILTRRNNVHFMIVGDGELRERLAGSPAASRLDGRLTWTGFTERIHEACFASDVVVLTSDNEGTPVSLIEAQAAALPVVCTDVGGVRAVVEDGVTGFIVSPSDTSGFAEAVGELLINPDLARRAGLAGRARVASRFGIDRLTMDIDSLYQSLIERARAR